MIGIVVVSHNPKLSEEVIRFADQMKFDDFKVINGGGMANGEFGTDPMIIVTAIQKANQGQGVLVFVDLGSAVMNAKMAIEMLDDPAIRLVDAPFVEGVVVAVASNYSGITLSELVQSAEETKQVNKT